MSWQKHISTRTHEKDFFYFTPARFGPERKYTYKELLLAADRDFGK